MKFFFLCFALSLLGSALARGFYRRCRDNAAKQSLPYSAHQVLLKLYPEIEVSKHTGLINNFFHSGQNRLYLSAPVLNGKQAAAWAIALQEAAHYQQQKTGDPRVKLRRGSIQMTRFLPPFILILGIILGALPHLPMRPCLLIALSSFPICLLLNLCSIGTEWRASKLTLQKLENNASELGLSSNDLEAIGEGLRGMNWRELGDLVDSPRLLLYQLLPTSARS